MRGVQDIKIQKLFLVAIILKVGFSAVGWWFNDPWILGFGLPLAVMAGYIAIGVVRKDTDVSDEKFADSCYYLGFIFTITSIILSLFDLPNIGTNLQSIAVRFGAAMVSTVAGLIVRVYLVSFRKDASDAVRDAEEELIEASNRFREHLVIAYEKLIDFQATVDGACRQTVERSNLQIAGLSKNYAEKLSGFFAELRLQNGDAFGEMRGSIVESTQALTQNLDDVAAMLTKNLKALDQQVLQFVDSMTQRLTSAMLPDAYVAAALDEPLGELRTASIEVAKQTKKVSEDIGGFRKRLGLALGDFASQANDTVALRAVLTDIKSQQSTALAAAKAHIDAVHRLESIMKSLERVVPAALQQIGEAAEHRDELKHAISELVLGNTATHSLLRETMRPSLNRRESMAYGMSSPTPNPLVQEEPDTPAEIRAGSTTPPRSAQDEVATSLSVEAGHALLPDNVAASGVKLLTPSAESVRAAE